MTQIHMSKTELSEKTLFLFFLLINDSFTPLTKVHIALLKIKTTVAAEGLNVLIEMSLLLRSIFPSFEEYNLEEDEILGLIMIREVQHHCASLTSERRTKLNKTKGKIRSQTKPKIF